MAVRPRLLEIIKFSKMMGWKKLGVAFCVGLANEARRTVEILEGAGFDVYSVCCKCGNVDKSEWVSARKIRSLAYAVLRGLRLAVIPSSKLKF